MSEVYDASDVTHIKRAEAEEAREARDFDTLLGWKPFRQWLYKHIYETCHVRRLSFAPGAEDASHFNEGARAVGEALLEKVRQTSPKAYIAMHEEHHFDE